VRLGEPMPDTFTLRVPLGAGQLTLSLARVP